MRALFVLPLAFLLPGCVASVVKDVVTAPVKVVSKTADVMTTSQSEADEKRGRALRKQEERLGKLARKRDEAREDCADGDREAVARGEVGEDEEDRGGHRLHGAPGAAEQHAEHLVAQVLPGGRQRLSPARR